MENKCPNRFNKHLNSTLKSSKQSFDANTCFNLSVIFHRQVWQTQILTEFSHTSTSVICFNFFNGLMDIDEIQKKELLQLNILTTKTLFSLQKEIKMIFYLYIISSGNSCFILWILLLSLKLLVKSIVVIKFMYNCWTLLFENCIRCRYVMYEWINIGI